MRCVKVTKIKNPEKVLLFLKLLALIPLDDEYEDEMEPTG